MAAHLLTPRELELGSPEGFNGRRPVAILGADGHDGLSDVHTCNCALWFAKCTTHSSLEPETNRKKSYFVSMYMFHNNFLNTDNFIDCINDD